MSQQIKLYLDEDAQRHSLSSALKGQGIDVLTASEANMLGCPDEDQLNFAFDESRVIFSFNRRDFAQLHKLWLSSGKPHAGIILSNQISTWVILKQLLKLIDSKSAEEMESWIEFLGNWK